jgi:hypothetical protein
LTGLKRQRLARSLPDVALCTMQLVEMYGLVDDGRELEENSVEEKIRAADRHFHALDIFFEFFDYCDVGFLGEPYTALAYFAIDYITHLDVSRPKAHIWDADWSNWFNVYVGARNMTVGHKTRHYAEYIHRQFPFDEWAGRATELREKFNLPE